MREDMKRTTFVFVFAVAAAAVSAASGGEVSPDEAKEAVAGWLALRASPGELPSGAPVDVKEYAGDGGKGRYYVIALEGGGFVVAGADTSFEPVLAYSKSGEWEGDAAKNPLMAMVSCDVAAAVAANEAATDGSSAGAAQRAGAGAAGKAAAKWAKYRAAADGASGRAGAGASAPADLRVSPLVASSWSQSGRGENRYTPQGYVCGCVATMGGQIMRYWKWPDSTVNVTAAGNFYSDVVYSGGTRGWNISDGYYASYSASAKTSWSPAFGGTYDWANINLNPSYYDSDAKKAALGKLTRDVGLACYMRYASGGSGSPGPVIGHRFVDTFGYANAKIFNGWNNNAYLASIDAGMPCAVNVSGSSGGHAIVGDGYGYDSSGTLFVHFNMGWGDVGSDRWYTPPNIGNFTSVGGCVYNIYPPSKGAGDLTVVSGRVLSGDSAVGGATVTAVNRETGASYTTTSSNGGNKSFNGETSATVAKGIYALMLPAGFYTITAAGSGGSARVERQVHSCLSAAWAGAGGQSVGGRVGNIHGLDLNLGTAVSAPAVELTHRWSFDGSLSDSKGGSDAKAIGSAVEISDGKAKMTGSGNGQGSLNLGANLLDGDAATIEIWASQTAVRSWARVFDYGIDNTHYFCLSWSNGTDIMQDRAGSKNTAEAATDNTMAPYAVGVQYHISATFERQSDGGTAVRFMKRDAASGRLLRSGVLTVGTGLHNISNPVLYLGHSFFPSDADACAEYDEVRIWKGVLSDAQLSANAKAGPDVLLASVPASTEYTYIATATWKGEGTPTAADLANRDNWTCQDNNGKAVSGVPGAKTRVIVPSGGSTAFSIPDGFTPVWRKVQIGGDGSATMWASNATLNSSLSSLMLHGANKYATRLGTGAIDTMQRGLIHNPENNPAVLEKRQLRFDGWFYVDSYKAGSWKLHGYVDDYIAFKVDDEWALYGRTMGECFGSIDMTAGWHRYTMIVGDTGGGYGGCIVAGNHKKLTPLAVKIDGGSELAFSTENFTFATSSQKVVKLSADCDWRALGKITVDGAAIDLDGHALKIDSATASFLGSKIKNGTLEVYGAGVDADNLVLENVVVASEPAATPVSPTAAAYVADTCEVSLECATAGATIYYTIDGSEPTKESAVYAAPFSISGTVTVKAVAFAPGWLESGVFERTFSPAPAAAAATGSSVSGYRSGAVTLASDIPGATIRYTVDGTDPTPESPVYDGSIPFTSGGTLKAVVFADGYRPSEVLTYEYFVKRLFGETSGANAAKYPDTPEMRAAHWIEETEQTHEATGVWSPSVAYEGGAVSIDDDGVVFTPDSASDGRNVTVEAEIVFGSQTDEPPRQDAGVKTAVTLGANGRLQVYSLIDGATAWQDVSAEGFAPAIDTEYTAVFSFDCAKKTFTLGIVDGSGTTNAMENANGETRFTVASALSSPVESIGFSGSGSVRSIFWRYDDAAAAAFDEGDVVAGGAITRAQAEWLNARGEYETVKAKLDLLSAGRFAEAYLLNLDFTSEAYANAPEPKYEFKVTGVDVAADKVTVTVTLKRGGARLEGGVNGELRLYGGVAPGAFGDKPLAVEKITNATFSGDGDEESAVIEYGRTGAAGEAKFFQPRIEAK